MSLPHDVAGWNLLLSILSFGVFCISTVVLLAIQLIAAVTSKNATAASGDIAKTAAAGNVGAQNLAPVQSTVNSLAELLKALGGVMDAIVKAGPGLAGLVASILFMAIAAWTVAKPADPAVPKCSIPVGTPLATTSEKVSGAAVAVVCGSAEPKP